MLLRLSTIQETRDLIARSSSVPSPLHLLVYTRELLEYRGDTSLPFARLYGNWAVHTRISGSRAGYEMLVRINERLATFGSGSDPAPDASLQPLIRTIAEELSTARFLRELRSLFEREELSAPFLYRADLWAALRSGVLNELRGKPVQFPDGDSTTWKPSVRTIHDQARERMRVAYGHTRGFVRHFTIDILDQSAANSGGTHRGWKCVCTTEHGFHIQVDITSSMLDDAPGLFQGPFQRHETS